ncbi:type I restriction endonuclease [Halodesulfovibrio aestuarii]|uniref:type I restriction endonuclease n=1 Tax=Halodesulfovibrio aestuarii TaxID=126333 RepID=UPI003D33FEDC
MDFADHIQRFTDRVESMSGHINTEEAAKSALVMPFLQTLGYDAFDPRVVVPEFTADIGTKKGEKVDYAIVKDEEPIMLIECKNLGDPLDESKAAQLHRYFHNIPSARVGILTDGVRYKFFSDLDKPNIMDSRPFMDIDFNHFDETLLEDLRKLTNDKFDVNNALCAAQNLKYTREIKKIFKQELEEPTDAFIKHFASQVYSGPMRANVVEDFKERVISALEGHINDVIQERLQSAMFGGAKPTIAKPADQPTPAEAAADEENCETAPVEPESEVVTTEEEMEGYLTVKAILSQVIAPERVVMRDRKTYCGIILDDNGRKPLCRLHFNTAQKYVGLFDEEKNETRHPIEQLNELFQFSDQLKERALAYDA